METATGRRAASLTLFLAGRGIARPEIAAIDVLNLARGMIDGALDADPADLTWRIARAILGYLGALSRV